jgi:hypothetical protein
MRNYTKQKYFEALKYMATVDTFHSKQTAKKLNITHTFFCVCTELGLLRRGMSNGTYAWNLTRAPMLSDVEAIDLRLKAKMAMHKVKKETPQLTIKPIRKAPAPTPMPIVHEPECDNSNSKMLLIMAVGAIIGFMIATIIWK